MSVLYCQKVLVNYESILSERIYPKIQLLWQLFVLYCLSSKLFRSAQNVVNTSTGSPASVLPNTYFFFILRNNGVVPSINHKSQKNIGV